MPNYFTQSRNVELSTLYYLKTQIDANWTGITTCKTFKKVYTKNVPLPIVCIRLADTVSTRLEIGSNTLEDRYLIIIDIFSRSDGQRVDLAYFIKDKLKDGFIHYDHSHISGDKSGMNQTPNGRDYVTDWITDGKVDVGETEDEKDRYRHNISIQIRKSS